MREGRGWCGRARSLARKARCGRHGRRQRHCTEVKRVNPVRAVGVKCLNCRVTVRKTARRLCEFGIKEAREWQRNEGGVLSPRVIRPILSRPVYSRVPCRR